MVQCRIFDRGQYDVQHFFINVCLQIQVQGVNEDSDFEWVILDAYDVQINELLVGYLIFSGSHELIVVVFFAVHLKNNVDIISCYQEPLSVVLCYSLLNRSTRDNNLFIVSLVVLPVGSCFYRKGLIIE